MSLRNNLIQRCIGSVRTDTCELILFYGNECMLKVSLRGSSNPKLSAVMVTLLGDLDGSMLSNVNLSKK